MSDREEKTRRYVLRLTGATTIAGLAGCAGGGQRSDGQQGGQRGGGRRDGGQQGGQQGGGGGQQGTRRQSGRGLGPVPDEYETATAQGGMQRDPEKLQTKQALNYQSTPNDGEQCSDCRFYIPDKNGDGLGACTLVEGKIEPEGWCVSFATQQ